MFVKHVQDVASSSIQNGCIIGIIRGMKAYSFVKAILDHQPTSLSCNVSFVFFHLKSWRLRFTNLIPHTPGELSQMFFLSGFWIYYDWKSKQSKNNSLKNDNNVMSLKSMQYACIPK